MIIQICEKCHKPITCPLDACVCHAIKSEREKIVELCKGMKLLKPYEAVPNKFTDTSQFTDCEYNQALQDLITKLKT